MKEKLKNFLIIFAIWYGVVFTISASLCVLAALIVECPLKNLFSTAVWGALLIPPLIIPTYFIIIFCPTLIALLFLFKKYNKPETRKLIIRVAFPVTFCAYFLIEHIFLSGYTNDYFSLMACAYYLVVVMPLFIITILVIPKTLLPAKWDIFCESIFVGVISGILFFTCIFTTPLIDKIVFTKALKKYDTVIESVENYKKINGIYPLSIEDTVKHFKEFNYETYNEGKDYKISVSDGPFVQYNYCSSPEIFGCKEGQYSYMLYKEFGKWIKAVDND